MLVNFLAVLVLLISSAFASQISSPGQNPVPANFQNLPGPQAVVLMPSEVLDPDPDHVRMRFSNPPLELGEVILDGTEYQTVRLSGEGSTLEEGTPDLPRVTRMLIIGNTGNVSLNILDQSYTIQGGVLPSPVQPLVGDGDYQEFSFILPRDDVYQSDGWYPQEIATVSTPATLRDVRFVILTIFPVQINPVTGEMRVYDNIEVEVENIGGFGENQIYIEPTSITPSFRKLYETFENFEGSPLDALPVFPGSYLIICNNNATVIAQAQLLVNWRKRKGIDASYLALNIAGSTTAIRDTITNRYNASNGQLEFVCLFGDAPGTDPYDLPTHSTEYDNYYGCISAGGGPNTDPVPDVAIGRMSGASGSALAATVAKTINYESAPTEAPNTQWYTRTWCAAHTSQIPSNPATKQYTRQIMLLNGVTEATFTTYSGSVSETDIQNRLSAGITVFNHRMSWISETPSSALDALPTTGMQPLVMSITCGTGNFSSGTGLSEEWYMPVGQTVAAPKGAIGCVGIATSSTEVPYNNIVDAGTMYGLYALDIPEQGMALIAGKLQLYKNYAAFRFDKVQNFSWWANLMGDPGVPIWRHVPRHLTVTRPATINRGTNNVTLTVEDSITSSPVEGALVCLLKGSETFSRGYTATDGTINLPCNTPTTGYLHVTVTKDDVRPNLDSIQVVTPLAYLAHNGASLDDDNAGGTIGDNNDVVNPGETIDLTVNLSNTGTTNTVTGISGSLTTASAGVQILQAASTYPNIAPGANANNATAFRFAVSSVFNGEPITFFLNLTSSIGALTVRVDYTPVAGDVLYQSSTFSGPGGNIDPGESGNLSVTYRNSGARSLVSSNGILRSLDSYISVPDSVGAYGTVTPGTNGTNSVDLFSIMVSVGTYNGHRALMQLVVTDANGFRDSTDFYVTVGTQGSTSPSGPDAYGYYAYDNNETSPPGGASVYSWIEIAPSQGGSGTSCAFDDQTEDSDDVLVVNLPFSFTFYGQSFSQITVCSNGWLSMGSTTIDDYRNYRMGTPIGPPNQIAAYWDNLKAWGASNNAYYQYDAANHWFIVEWRAQTQWTTVNEFFEIILYDPAFYPSSTGDGKIKVQYHTVNLSPNQDPGNFHGPQENNYASIGIQNEDHSIGVDYYYWNVYSAGSAAITAGRAIMYTTDANGQLNPSITVSTPNGAENWYLGQPYNILWSSTAISGTVDIALNRSYPGGVWENLFTGSANDGVQSWSGTGLASTTSRIRIVSTAQPSIGDTSDANFSLVNPQVSVTSPNGGEVLTTDSYVWIQWTAVGLGPSTVSLNRNYPGGAWEVLETNGGTDLLWLVTGPPTANARIRVIGNAIPTAGDSSNANFTIGISPEISHSAHPDQAPGTAVFVAEVTDDVPGFTTKLFYRLLGAGSYDSLTMNSTGNPNEFAATTPVLSSNRYEYYLRSTDTQGLSTYDPASGSHKFDVGYFGTSWLGCDDGTAENYNWVDGPGFQWAVKFDPGSYPFALTAGRFAICPTCPTPEHDLVVFRVYLADGPGGLPGTIVFTDTAGSAGNVIGGLPAGAAFAEVITRSGGNSLTLNGAFYLSVENNSPRLFPVAFGHDTSGVRCNLSFFFDACEDLWFNENDVANPNARPGNRMIRASGFALTPPTVVVYRSGNNVNLLWDATGAPYYKVYSSNSPLGPFDTVLGTTVTNSFSDIDAVNLNLKRFYEVRSSDTP